MNCFGEGFFFPIKKANKTPTLQYVRNVNDAEKYYNIVKAEQGTSLLNSFLLWLKATLSSVSIFLKYCLNV